MVDWEVEVHKELARKIQEQEEEAKLEPVEMIQEQEEEAKLEISEFSSGVPLERTCYQSMPANKAYKMQSLKGYVFISLLMIS